MQHNIVVIDLPMYRLKDQKNLTNKHEEFWVRFVYQNV